ncbi:MAG TPA: DNA-processing protein DprA [Gemmatimonadales bacterium]|nr:DNA-processing protein DprA [Gemmatimonadales bacterium]
MAEAARSGSGELAAYLALAQIPGIGSARLRTLLDAFGSALGAQIAPVGAIAGLPGFGTAAANAVRAAGRAGGEEILRALDRIGARVLLPADPEFPPLLAETPEPPAALFVWGDVAILSRPAAAIVGSRDHTPYGATAARLLAGGVARSAVVVSGMARGLDAIAHAAALEAGGTTVGVLGNGFGVIYPAANRALYERVSSEGCLVTELPPGERPRVSTFPRRNRIIAGLAGVTVVVEAAVNSGALITADCALEQGRSVLAVPGPITSPTSEGCNKLIQQGAKPALSVADVLEELGLSAPVVQGPAAGGLTPDSRPGSTSRPQRPDDLTVLQRTLWDTLASEPTHVDALVAGAGQDVGQVLTALTELELRGLVDQKPGMIFELKGNDECRM